MKKTFYQKLVQGWEAGRFVCVGLDPRIDQIPSIPGLGESDLTRLARYMAHIVDGVGAEVLAFKPNIAFYEGLGDEGLLILEQLTEAIRREHPEAVLILDYKRGDIGDTNIPYVKLAADILGADAVTINPYMGREANMPFLDSELGVIPICKTSNPGSGEFQDRLVLLAGTELDQVMRTATRHVVTEYGGMQFLRLYQLVAHRVRYLWNYNQNCAVVVGATYPEELEAVRKIVGGMPILIPGIDKQGGDLEASVKAGLNGLGQGIMVNSSRGVTQRTMGSDAVQQALAEVRRLNTEILRVRSEVMAAR